MSDEKRITVEDDGQVLAQATVQVADDQSARAQVNVAAGHLPVDTRQKMADAVHEAVVEEDGRRLTASVPLGDTELIAGVSQHLTGVELRAAGSTSIVEGDVRSD